VTALRTRVQIALPGGDTPLIIGGAIAAALLAGLFAVSAYAVNPFVLPALLVGVGFVFVVLQRPYLGVAGAFLAAPAESASLPLPTGSLSPSEAALLLVGACWVGRVLIRPDTVALPKVRDVSVFALLACVAIGLVIAVDVAPVLRVLIIWSLFACVYFQAQSFTPQQMRVVIGSLIVGAGILGTIGAIAYLRSGQTTLYSGGDVTGARAVGTFADPNYYASLMVLALLPSAALILNNVRRNWWMLPFWGGALAGLAFSLSRGGTMGFAVGLLVLLLWRRARWVAVGIGFLFVVLTLFNANPLTKSEQFGNVTQRLSTITNGGANESSTNNRPRIWHLALEVTAQHPFFGIGVNQFQHQSAIHGLYERGTPLENAHMIPLSLSAELGVIGLAAFVLLVGQLAVRGRRALKASSSLPRVLALGLIAALAGFLIQGFTAAQIRDNLIMGTFFAFAGMLTGLSDQVTSALPAGEDVRSTRIPSDI
jgi:O-antigen ligase